jgi:hypothetical protein
MRAISLPGAAEPGEGLGRVVTLACRQHEIDMLAEHSCQPARVALGEMAHHLFVEAMDALYRGGRYRLGH